MHTFTRSTFEPNQARLMIDGRNATVAGRRFSVNGGEIMRSLRFVPFIGFGGFVGLLGFGGFSEFKRWPGVFQAREISRGRTMQRIASEGRSLGAPFSADSRL